MDLEAARAEIIKSAKNMPRLLGNLEKLKLEERSSRLREQIGSIELELAQQEKPYRTIPEIENWKAEHSVRKSRYRFLVLVGPSGKGKTQFAKSLVPRGRFLDLNMAAAPEPNLKEYDHELHDLILFDECSAKKVLLQTNCFRLRLLPYPWVSRPLDASLTMFGCMRSCS